MAKPLELHLTEEERAGLEKARDTHAKPYIRERCAALLKIAAGYSGREVALQRLHKAHAPDTVYEWVDRYRSGGLEGLVIRSGRGRKPAFSPSVSDGGASPGGIAGGGASPSPGLRSRAKPVDA